MSPRDDSARAELVRLLATRSLKRGRFTLASGKESAFYIDARITSMSPEGLALIGTTGLRVLRAAGWNPDSVGGLTLGADPIAYAIAYASVSDLPLVRAFTVRKEPKQHGTGRVIEGPFESTDRVAVIEDVITTGGSALRAISAIREAGALILGVLALVDREEGGRDAIEAVGVPVQSLTTISEVLAWDPSS